jgi:outer membrane protein OmpA-like peptidoglycan-associated protein
LRNGPVPIIGAVVALLLAAGLIGWLFNGSSGSDEVTIGGSESDGAAAQQDGSADGQGDGAAGLPPLSPAALPAADEPGLVGMELALMDVYTGTGSSGSVQLYLNSLTGQVCHQFTAGAMSGRYRAYIHEARFPQEGPIVVDLGEVENEVPRCVNSNAIDLARALADGDGFYVAAHSANQDFVLRGQLSSAATAFDNRDPATIANQAAAATTATTVGDGSEDDLFGMPDEGAYLVVDAGRVTFEGLVPDADTADRLRAAFVPLSGMGVEVVDNLVVQSGSPPPSGRVIVADALLFDSGQERIAGDSPVLATLADLMVVNPTWTMTITGHTDNVGDWLFNIELSLRRANNVRSRLAELGVPAERIRVQGAGPEQPIADNETDEGRARNRRIEVSIDS